MEMIDFEILGFTKNESKVYTTLIEFGELTAGELSAKSSVPYGKIYTVLKSLANKGFVKIVPGKTKKFTPTDPDNLDRIIQEKEKVLTNAKDKIKELKKFYDVKEKNPVKMGIGKKAFYEIIKESIKAENYSYSIKWSSEYRPDWVESVRKKIKKGIDVKTLARYDEETKKNVNAWLKTNKNIRKIQDEGIAFSVQDDEEVMISLIKSNITLLIKDEPFAKLMKKMFLATYDQAEHVN